MKAFWLFPILFTAVLLLSFGCTTSATTVDGGDGGVEVEKYGLALPTTFYVLKSNDSEYINNITFKEYSSYLVDILDEGGWTYASYGDAKTFLFLEYGIGSFYETSVTIKPKYDRETGKTKWVHEGKNIESMPFVRIKGVQADEYRTGGKERVSFSLLVKQLEKEAVDQALVKKMIKTGSHSLF
jgi:hypothetical protein